MTTKNDITGDRLATKEATDAYREGYDRIFGKKPPHEEAAEALVEALTPAVFFKIADDEETE